MIANIIKLIRKIRQIYWKYRLGKCGENFCCCSGVTIHSARKISVGNSVRIGERSYLNARGGIKIGNNVQFGPQVFIWSSNHNYYSPKKLPYDNKQIDKLVTIEDNVWIGYSCIILKGVHIGKNTVIGAGSVVTKDIPQNVIAAGVPCKVKKKIEDENSNIF